MADEKKPETKPAPTKDESVGSLLLKYLPDLKALAPKHVTPERLVKVLQTSIKKSDKLQACSVGSLVAAMTVAAELGLEPGGALGHLYLVPFKGVCTVIVGYRGYVELMLRSGRISTVRAVLVHAKDKFTYTEGLRQRIEHVPCLEQEPGEMTHVYCVTRSVDGAYSATVMSKAQVDRHRARSLAANSGPWVTDYEAMAQKTVVRVHSKLQPMSAELGRALEVDDSDVIDGEVMGRETLSLQASTVQTVPTATQTAKAAVKRRMEIVDLTTQPAKPAPVTSDGPPPDSVPLPTESGESEVLA